MLGLLLATCLAKPANPPEVKAFIKAYEAINLEYDPERGPNRSISRALNILMSVTKKGLPMEPFEKAVATDYGTDRSYNSVSGGIDRFGKFTFATVRMGQVSRTEAYDNKGRIQLPKEFSWNTPWYPRPRLLPSGLVLMDETAVEHGVVIEIRLVWLRKEGRRFVKVKETTSGWSLGQPEPIVKGNQVITYTLDDFECLRLSDPVLVPERVTTWDGSWPKPRVVKKVLRNQPLRFVDHLVAKTLRTRKPTRLYHRIREALETDFEFDPKNIPVDVYLEKTMPDGSVKEILNEDVVFHLKRSPTGYRLISLSKVKG